MLQRDITTTQSQESFSLIPPELITGCLTKFESFDISREQIEHYRDIVSTRKPYIICFTPRSGSSYLADLLTGSKSLGAPGEFFSEGLMDLTLYHMRASDYAGKTIVDYLTWLMQNLSSANGVFGFKVSYFDCLPLIDSGLDKLLFSDFKLIYLYRKNILRQAVSLYIATETSLFHTNIPIAEETKEAAESLPYNQEKIRYWIEHIWLQEKAWRKYLARQNKEYLEIDYDQVSADSEQILSLIAQYLGKELPKNTTAGKSVFQKVRTSNNERLFERFLEDKANKEFLLGLGLDESRHEGE